MLFFCQDFKWCNFTKIDCMSVTYHVTIKKEYAEAVLADLEKMDAVQLSKEEDTEVPEWQKEEVRRRISEIKRNPSILVDSSVIFNMLKVD